jgi:spore germination cell wall hydrolase CwlJ-like protein
MSIVSESASVTIAIPRDEVATILQPAPFELASIPVKADVSPLVAELAAARHLDAVEDAMAVPPSWAKPELHVAPESAPVAAAASLPIILASADEGSVPETAMSPTLASLPMSSAIPLDMVPMPRPAPGVPPPSPAQRLHLQGAERAKAERCLANAIYFEARSEPVRGQMAVAQVMVNRAFSGFYPNDICGVVYQNSSRHLACQFTFTCDGKRKLIDERGAWARANRIAKQTLDGEIYVPEVAKSTHYHAVYVHPDWVREMKKMVRFGTHNFYRPIAWGNGAQEPVWGTASLAANKKN